MRISELIADLQTDLVVHGDVEVCAETATNQPVTGTLYARLTDTGRYTLFLLLEGGEGGRMSREDR
jgi:hypothetical protein